VSEWLSSKGYVRHPYLHKQIAQECMLDLNQFVTRKATRRFLPTFED
jgi:hypothetical protein